MHWCHWLNLDYTYAVICWLSMRNNLGSELIRRYDGYDLYKCKEIAFVWMCIDGFKFFDIHLVSFLNENKLNIFNTAIKCLVMNVIPKGIYHQKVIWYYFLIYILSCLWIILYNWCLIVVVCRWLSIKISAISIQNVIFIFLKYVAYMFLCQEHPTFNFV